MGSDTRIGTINARNRQPTHVLAWAPPALGHSTRTRAGAFENAAPPTLDRATLLRQLDGDEDALRAITTLFLNHSPRWQADVRDAVECSDADKLERAAHHLKGAIGNFGHAAAHAAAQHLESIGRARDLSQATAALHALQDAMAQLENTLTQWVA